MDQALPLPLEDDDIREAVNTPGEQPPDHRHMMKDIFIQAHGNMEDVEANEAILDLCGMEEDLLPVDDLVASWVTSPLATDDTELEFGHGFDYDSLLYSQGECDDATAGSDMVELCFKGSSCLPQESLSDSGEGHSTTHSKSKNSLPCQTTCAPTGTSTQSTDIPPFTAANLDSDSSVPLTVHIDRPGSGQGRTFPVTVFIPKHLALPHSQDAESVKSAPPSHVAKSLKPFPHSHNAESVKSMPHLQDAENVHPAWPSSPPDIFSQVAGQLSPSAKTQADGSEMHGRTEGCLIDSVDCLGHVYSSVSLMGPEYSRTVQCQAVGEDGSFNPDMTEILHDKTEVGKIGIGLECEQGYGKEDLDGLSDMHGHLDLPSVLKDIRFSPLEKMSYDTANDLSGVLDVNSNELDDVETTVPGDENLELYSMLEEYTFTPTCSSTVSMTPLSTALPDVTLTSSTSSALPSVTPSSPVLQAEPQQVSLIPISLPSDGKRGLPIVLDPGAVVCSQSTANEDNDPSQPASTPAQDVTINEGYITAVRSPGLAATVKNFTFSNTTLTLLANQDVCGDASQTTATPTLSQSCDGSVSWSVPACSSSQSGDWSTSATVPTHSMTSQGSSFCLSNAATICFPNQRGSQLSPKSSTVYSPCRGGIVRDCLMSTSTSSAVRSRDTGGELSKSTAVTSSKSTVVTSSKSTTVTSSKSTAVTYSQSTAATCNNSPFKDTCRPDTKLVCAPFASDVFVLRRSYTCAASNSRTSVTETSAASPSTTEKIPGKAENHSLLSKVDNNLSALFEDASGEQGTKSGTGQIGSGEDKQTADRLSALFPPRLGMSRPQEKETSATTRLSGLHSENADKNIVCPKTSSPLALQTSLPIHQFRNKVFIYPFEKEEKQTTKTSVAERSDGVRERIATALAVQAESRAESQKVVRQIHRMCTAQSVGKVKTRQGEFYCPADYVRKKTVREMLQDAGFRKQTEEKEAKLMTDRPAHKKKVGTGDDETSYNCRVSPPKERSGERRKRNAEDSDSPEKLFDSSKATSVTGVIQGKRRKVESAQQINQSAECQADGCATTPCHKMPCSMNQGDDDQPAGTVWKEKDERTQSVMPQTDRQIVGSDTSKGLQKIVQSAAKMLQENTPETSKGNVDSVQHCKLPAAQLNSPGNFASHQLLKLPSSDHKADTCMRTMQQSKKCSQLSSKEQDTHGSWRKTVQNDHQGTKVNDQDTQVCKMDTQQNSNHRSKQHSNDREQCASQQLIVQTGPLAVERSLHSICGNIREDVDDNNRNLAERTEVDNSGSDGKMRKRGEMSVGSPSKDYLPSEADSSLAWSVKCVRDEDSSIICQSQSGTDIIDTGDIEDMEVEKGDSTDAVEKPEVKGKSSTRLDIDSLPVVEKEGQFISSDAIHDGDVETLYQAPFTLVLHPSAAPTSENSPVRGDGSDTAVSGEQPHNSPAPTVTETVYVEVYCQNTQDTDTQNSTEDVDSVQCEIGDSFATGNGTVQSSSFVSSDADVSQVTIVNRTGGQLTQSVDKALTWGSFNRHRDVNTIDSDRCNTHRDVNTSDSDSYNRQRDVNTTDSEMYNGHRDVNTMDSDIYHGHRDVVNTVESTLCNTGSAQYTTDHIPSHPEDQVALVETARHVTESTTGDRPSDPGNHAVDYQGSAEHIPKSSSYSATYYCAGDGAVTVSVPSTGVIEDNIEPLSYITSGGDHQVVDEDKMIVTSSFSPWECTIPGNCMVDTDGSLLSRTQWVGVCVSTVSTTPQLSMKHHIDVAPSSLHTTKLSHFVGGCHPETVFDDLISECSPEGIPACHTEASDSLTLPDVVGDVLEPCMYTSASSISACLPDLLANTSDIVPAGNETCADSGCEPTAVCQPRAPTGTKKKLFIPCPGDCDDAGELSVQISPDSLSKDSFLFESRGDMDRLTPALPFGTHVNMDMFDFSQMDLPADFHQQSYESLEDHKQFSISDDSEQMISIKNERSEEAGIDALCCEACHEDTELLDICTEPSTTMISEKTLFQELQDVNSGGLIVQTESDIADEDNERQIGVGDNVDPLSVWMEDLSDSVSENFDDVNKTSRTASLTQNNDVETRNETEKVQMCTETKELSDQLLGYLYSSSCGEQEYAPDVPEKSAETCPWNQTTDMTMVQEMTIDSSACLTTPVSSNENKQSGLEDRGGENICMNSDCNVDMLLQILSQPGAYDDDQTPERCGSSSRQVGETLHCKDSCLSVDLGTEPVQVIADVQDSCCKTEDIFASAQMLSLSEMSSFGSIAVSAPTSEDARKHVPQDSVDNFKNISSEYLDKAFIPLVFHSVENESSVSRKLKTDTQLATLHDAGYVVDHGACMTLGRTDASSSLASHLETCLSPSSEETLIDLASLLCDHPDPAFHLCTGDQATLPAVTSHTGVLAGSDVVTDTTTGLFSPQYSANIGNSCIDNSFNCASNTPLNDSANNLIYQAGSKTFIDVAHKSISHTALKSFSNVIDKSWSDTGNKSACNSLTPYPHPVLSEPSSVFRSFTSVGESLQHCCHGAVSMSSSPTHVPVSVATSLATSFSWCPPFTCVSCTSPASVISSEQLGKYSSSFLQNDTHQGLCSVSDCTSIVNSSSSLVNSVTCVPFLESNPRTLENILSDPNCSEVPAGSLPMSECMLSKSVSATSLHDCLLSAVTALQTTLPRLSDSSHCESSAVTVPSVDFLLSDTMPAVSDHQNCAVTLNCPVSSVKTEGVSSSATSVTSLWKMAASVPDGASSLSQFDHVKQPRKQYVHNVSVCPGERCDEQGSENLVPHSDRLEVSTVTQDMLFPTINLPTIDISDISSESNHLTLESISSKPLCPKALESPAGSISISEQMSSKTSQVLLRPDPKHSKLPELSVSESSFCAQPNDVMNRTAGASSVVSSAPTSSEIIPEHCVQLSSLTSGKSVLLPPCPRSSSALLPKNVRSLLRQTKDNPALSKPSQVDRDQGLVTSSRQLSALAVPALTTPIMSSRWCESLPLTLSSTSIQVPRTSALEYVVAPVPNSKYHPCPCHPLKVDVGKDRPGPPCIPFSPALLGCSSMKSLPAVAACPHDLPRNPYCIREGVYEYHPSAADIHAAQSLYSKCCVSAPDRDYKESKRLYFIKTLCIGDFTFHVEDELYGKNSTVGFTFLKRMIWYKLALLPPTTVEAANRRPQIVMLEMDMGNIVGLWGQDNKLLLELSAMPDMYVRNKWSRKRSRLKDFSGGQIKKIPYHFLTFTDNCVKHLKSHLCEHPFFCHLLIRSVTVDLHKTFPSADLSDREAEEQVCLHWSPCNKQEGGLHTD